MTQGLPGSVSEYDTGTAPDVDAAGDVVGTVGTGEVLVEEFERSESGITTARTTTATTMPPMSQGRRPSVQPTVTAYPCEGRATIRRPEHDPAVGAGSANCCAWPEAVHQGARP